MGAGSTRAAPAPAVGDTAVGDTAVGDTAVGDTAGPAVGPLTPTAPGRR